MIFLLVFPFLQLAAGLCCGLSCLAAGGTIGVIGDVGVVGFGLKASGGRRWWYSEGGGADGGEDTALSRGDAEESNKLYVGLLIMLIFSEALAL
jgi:V-type H+-transporting ATPase proteolipid subunit